MQSFDDRTQTSQAVTGTSPFSAETATARNRGRVSWVLTLLVTLAVSGFVLGTHFSAVDARQPGKGIKWTEVDAGAVPTAFGDLVGFTGDVSNNVMCFKDDRGVIRIVTFRGGKLATRCTKIERESN